MRAPPAGVDRPALRTVLRELPGPVRMLVVGVAVNRMGSFVSLFLVLHALALGLRPTEAGLLLTAYGAGAVVGVGAGGPLSDRFGARRTVVASMASSAVFVGLIPLAESPGALLVLSAASGLTTQLYRPAAGALLAALTAPDRLVLTTAAYRLGLNAGATAGPLLGGVLAAWSTDLVFVVDAATAALFAVLALTALPADHRQRSARPPRGARRALLGDHRFALVIVGMFLVALVEVQYLTVLPLELRARGLPLAAYTAVVSLNALLVITLELPLTAVVRRWPLRTVIPAGVALIAAGIALLGFPGGILGLLVATLVWTAGEILSAPSASAYPALAAPPGMRGTYIAALAAGQSAGYAVGPALGALVYEHSGDVIWTLCALVGGAAALAMWTGVREPAAAAETEAPAQVG